MQTQRLFEIIYLLLEKGSMTARELAQRLEVSSRTIRRDIEKLSGAGIPIYMTRGKGGGIHLMENFVLSKSLLSQSEQDEILFALRALEGTGIGRAPSSTSMSPSEHESHGALGTFDRLAALFQKNDAMDWIEIDFESWGTTPSTKNYFSICQQGIQQQKLLEFDYFASPSRPGLRTATHRSVEPYRLIFHTNCWYLSAFCLLRNEWRMFKLSRIRSLVATNVGFVAREVPPEPKEKTPYPLVHAKLHFNAQAAFRVLDEFPLAQVELEPDGSLIVEADVVDAMWIPGYLVSYGGEVEIIEPETWKKQVIRMSKEIIARYE